MFRLECIGLSKAFGAHSILAGVTFSLEQGKTLAVLGRSGSGKTTLLKCLNLLLPYDSGVLSLDGQEYCLDGKPIFAPWEVRTKIGLVFQEYNLFPSYSVSGNIELAMTHVKNIPRQERVRRMARVCEALEISGLLDRYPHELSGGQAQRVALARALVLHPTVLLLDEVTSALDPESVASVVKGIKEIRALEENRDLVIVLVTHMVRFAERFADDVAFLHEGKFVEMYPAKAFRSLVDSEVAKTFVSEFVEL